LKFEFDLFLSVSGQTDPVYRNRTPAVLGDRSVKNSLVMTGITEPETPEVLACRASEGLSLATAWQAIEKLWDCMVWLFGRLKQRMADLQVRDHP